MQTIEPEVPSARERLLAAAAEVFTQLGNAGATTRRIAKAAGVHEVTIFRIFGTKDALLEEARRQLVSSATPATLPTTVKDPEREIAAWAEAEQERVKAAAGWMRQFVAEPERREVHDKAVRELVLSVVSTLRTYLQQPGAPGAQVSPELRETAVSMFIGSLMADVVVGGERPELLHVPEAERVRGYVRVLLAALR